VLLFTDCLLFIYSSAQMFVDEENAPETSGIHSTCVTTPAPFVDFMYNKRENNMLLSISLSHTHTHTQLVGYSHSL